MSEFLDIKRREVQERIEFIEPLVAELPVLRRTAAALRGQDYMPTGEEAVVRRLHDERDRAREKLVEVRRELAAAQARISELESGRKDADDGGAKTPLSRSGGPGVETSGASGDTMLPPTPGEAPVDPQPVESTNGRKTPVKVRVEQVRDWVCGQSEPFATSDVAKALDISEVTARRKLEELPNGMIRRPAGSPTSGGHARWEYVPVDPTSGPRRRPRGEDRGPRNATAPVPHTGRPKGPSDKPGAGKPGQLRRKKKGGQVMRIGGAR
jgi:hypothetical protein